jgi:hypothetical protein
MSYKLKLIAYLLLVPLTIPLVLQMSVLPLQFAMGFNLIPEDQLWVLYLFLACAVAGLGCCQNNAQDVFASGAAH